MQKIKNFFSSKTNITSLVAVLFMWARQQGFITISDDTYNAIMTTFGFLVGIFIRDANVKAAARVEAAVQARRF